MYMEFKDKGSLTESPLLREAPESLQKSFRLIVAEIPGRDVTLPPKMQHGGRGKHDPGLWPAR